MHPFYWDAPTDMNEPLPSLPCDIAPFVPQTQGMCLLDRIVCVSGDSLTAEVTPGNNDVFATPDGIPGWVGLEWLAQAVAAWAGWQSAQHGKAPDVGFLVGTRRFETTLPHFLTGHTYRVSVHLEFQADNGLGHFRGSISRAESTCAEGSLTVYQPASSHPSLNETEPRTS